MRQKYRGRLAARLGFGLPEPCERPAGQPLIWLHALSLGEVSSAAPLIAGLRQALPGSCLVLTTSTSSGLIFARERLHDRLNHILPAPFDLLPTIRRFLRRLRPDLFILVETDFWPNWLTELNRRQVPLILVNGRISERSWQWYRRFSFVFRPLFHRFSLVCTQTCGDAARFAAMGLAEQRTVVLGNLKFASLRHRLRPPIPAEELGFSPGTTVWLCGSTHEGEEEIILRVFLRLRRDLPRLELLLAPRDAGRANKIIRLAAGLGLDCRRRSVPGQGGGAPILVLDTLGELAACYGSAAVAFIGGSLIAAGGHNPLEAASLGLPILYGPHMEDFQEIARELEEAGGATTVRDADSLFAALSLLLADPDHCKRMGLAAADIVSRHEGVVERHLERILPLCRPAG